MLGPLNTKGYLSRIYTSAVFPEKPPGPPGEEVAWGLSGALPLGETACDPWVQRRNSQTLFRAHFNIT